MRIGYSSGRPVWRPQMMSHSVCSFLGTKMSYRCVDNVRNSRSCHQMSGALQVLDLRRACPDWCRCCSNLLFWSCLSDQHLRSLGHYSAHCCLCYSLPHFDQSKSLNCFGKNHTRVGSHPCWGDPKGFRSHNSHWWCPHLTFYAASHNFTNLNISRNSWDSRAFVPSHHPGFKWFSEFGKPAMTSGLAVWWLQACSGSATPAECNSGFRCTESSFRDDFWNQAWIAHLFRGVLVDWRSPYFVRNLKCSGGWCSRWERLASGRSFRCWPHCSSTCFWSTGG